MNAAAVNMSAPMGAAGGFAGGARGYAAAAGGEAEAPKEISTEQIQVGGRRCAIGASWRR